MLHLTFVTADRPHLPERHKGAITFVLPNGEWQGTIGMPNDTANYTHTYVVSGDVRKKLSDLLQAQGVSPGDAIHFEVLERAKLQFLRVGSRRSGSR